MAQIFQIILMLGAIYLAVYGFLIHFQTEKYHGCCIPDMKDNAVLVIIWGIMYFLLISRWVLHGLDSKIPTLDDIAWYMNEMLAMIIMYRFFRTFSICAKFEGLKYEKDNDDDDYDSRNDNY